MNKDIMFSMVMFKDGTVEITWRMKEGPKVYRLKPRNPAVALLPLMSALGLAMGSDILLRQQVARMQASLEAKE